MAEVKLELKVMKELRLNGSIITLVTARKAHKCHNCGLPIEPGEQHYTIIKGGSGLGGLKFPKRCHLNCIDNYLVREGAMTIDKAIETLTELRGYPKPGFNGEDALAITLGIEALKLIGQHPTIRFFLANKLLPGEAEE